MKKTEEEIKSVKDWLKSVSRGAEKYLTEMMKKQPKKFTDLKVSWL